MFRHALLPFLALTLAAETPSPQAPKPLPAAAQPAPDKVLAWIGKQAIRQSDFDTFVELAVPPQQRNMLQMVPAMKQQYLKQFLDLNVLAAKAKQDKLDAAPAFQRKLAMRRQETLAYELVQRDAQILQKQVDLSDGALKAYYDKHIDQFKTPGSYTVRHILIGTKDNPRSGGQGLEDAEAKAKAAKLLEEIMGGKKLSDLTQANSDDPGSKENGGLYENIPFGKFAPPFEEAVKKLSPGQVSEPVRTMFGYHLIQLEKLTPEETPAFDKVKEKVRQACLPAQQEEVFRKYVDEAKKGLGYREVAQAPAQAPAAPKGAPKAQPKPAAKAPEGAK